MADVPRKIYSFVQEFVFLENLSDSCRQVCLIKGQDIFVLLEVSVYRTMNLYASVGVILNNI